MSRRLKLAALLAFVNLGPALAADSVPSKYEIRCTADLINGGTPIKLSAVSKPFVGNEVTSGSEVSFVVGPYTVLGKIDTRMDYSCAVQVASTGKK